MENKEKPLFKTVYGTFKDNVITCKGMDEVECVSYLSYRKEIEGKTGFYQLQYHKGLEVYIVQNFVEVYLEDGA